MGRMIAVKPAIVWHGSYAEDRAAVSGTWLLKALATAVLFGDGFLVDLRLLLAAHGPMRHDAMTLAWGFRRMISRQYVRVLSVNPSVNEQTRGTYQMIDWPAPQPTPLHKPSSGGFIEMTEGNLGPEQRFGGSNPPGLDSRDDRGDASMIVERLLRSRPSGDGRAFGQTPGAIQSEILRLMTAEVVSLTEADVWQLLESSMCDERGCRNTTEESRRRIMAELNEGFTTATGHSSGPDLDRPVGSAANGVAAFLESIPAQAKPIIDQLIPWRLAFPVSAPIVIRTIDVLGFIACW